MRRLVGAALALVLLAGCRVGVTVGVDAEADGTGRVRAVVTLDQEAAGRVPDLADQLRTDDLVAAGWEVDGPRPTEEGGVEVEATKRFRSVGEAAQVVEELSGSDGPFRDFRLRRSRSFLKTRTAFEGTVDLTSGIEAFSDEALQRRLGGSPLGFDPTELERRLGTTLDRIFDFRVIARLPGDTDSNAPTEAANGAVWRPTLGEQVQITATAEQWNIRNLAAATVSVLAAAAFIFVLQRRLRDRLR